MESFQIPVLEPLPNLEPDTVLFEDYDADGKLMGPATAIPLHTAEAAQSFPPHPPYQFCTPVSRSHTARMIDNQTAPFIPYPEDASFPREEYLKEFQGVQWVLDQQDPDGKYSFTEVIQFETVRRLHLDHGLSVERIDHLLNAYTSFRSLRLSNESGLLWDVSQRDLPPVIWADGSSLSPLPLNFLPTLPDPHNLFSQINNGILKFCPNLNCLTHNCRVHGTYNSQTWPKEPRHTSQDLHAQAENPCENQCFLLLAEEDMDVDDHMSANCLELLQSMLKLEPDMLPCDLAVICKIECRRVSLYPNCLDTIIHLPQPEVLHSKTQLCNPSLDAHILDSNMPCAHPGPCSTTNCDCYRLNEYCQRSCRCDSDCQRRWPGCDSTCSRNPQCGDRRCKCRSANRECDPERCQACDARYVVPITGPNVLMRDTVQGC
ncbi:hypothetical protein DFH06DRAFT_990479 [Mycena polygramma]|nr:hypothetical protein DFH06DRAFT_990479 [Mycena polygramma]